MKKLIAIIIAMTLLFSCIAIPASATQIQDVQETSNSSIIDSIVEFFKNLLNSIFSLFSSESQEPEAPKPYLVPQDGMEDTVVIDRNNNVVYGFKFGLLTEDLSEYIKVNDETIGKLEIIAIRNRVGTGTTINVIDNQTNEIVESFTVIIFADINGDGRTSSVDSSLSNTEALGESSWSDETSSEYSYAKTRAADLDGDGVITEEDYIIIANCVAATIKINQTTGKVIEQ